MEGGAGPDTGTGPGTDTGPRVGYWAGDGAVTGDGTGACTGTVSGSESADEKAPPAVGEIGSHVCVEAVVDSPADTSDSNVGGDWVSASTAAIAVAIESLSSSLANRASSAAVVPVSTAGLPWSPGGPRPSS